MDVAAEILRASGLEHLATAWLGWNSVTQQLAAAPAAVVLYAAVFLLCVLVYNLSKSLLTDPLRQGALEFIKTLSLCAYPFGHIMLRVNYGEPGFTLGFIPIITLTLLTFPEADGNPTATWAKYFNKITSLRKCIINTVIQIVAGLSAYRLGMLIMRLELHPLYIERLENHRVGVCKSALNVPVYAGFLAELLGVLYTTWFSSIKIAKNRHLDTLIKVANTSLVVSSGVRLTGMFIHPANATCHTFGCGNTPWFLHLLVYWVGPMLGVWFSMQIQSRFKGKSHSSKPAKTQIKRSKKESDNGRKESNTDDQTARRRKKFYK